MKPLQKSMVNFQGISDLHGKNSALFWGVGVIEWRLDLNCSRYILRFLDLGDLQVTDPMAAIVTKMLYQKILSICSGHSPEPKAHGSRIGLLSWKLTCPLTINGWKMYSLLKQSLFISSKPAWSNFLGSQFDSQIVTQMRYVWYGLVTYIRWNTGPIQGDM